MLCLILRRTWKRNDKLIQLLLVLLCLWRLWKLLMMQGWLLKQWLLMLRLWVRLQQVLDLLIRTRRLVVKIQCIV